MSLRWVVAFRRWDFIEATYFLWKKYTISQYKYYMPYFGIILYNLFIFFFKSISSFYCCKSKGMCKKRVITYRLMLVTGKTLLRKWSNLCKMYGEIWMNLSLLIDLPKIENKNNKRSISFIVYEKVSIMIVEARQPKKIKHNCQWGPLAVLRPPWFKVLTNFLLYQGEWIKKLLELNLVFIIMKCYAILLEQ